jgi:hypothetical protein
MQPANRFAVAMPVMKAIYKDAGLVFPNVDNANDIHGVLPDVKRAEVLALQTKSKLILEKINRRKI